MPAGMHPLWVRPMPGMAMPYPIAYQQVGQALAPFVVPCLLLALMYARTHTSTLETCWQFS